METTLYDSRFYDSQQEGSTRSARVVGHLVYSKLGRPATVLDIGCGVGTWGAEFARLGCDVIGVDGSYVDRGRLLIPEDRFVAHDLTAALDLGKRFDLVVSLEVVEHIDPAYEGTFVGSLTRHSDVILFSGAAPGQWGIGHVNEQWPSYWVTRFAERGYQLFDVVRPAIWNDPDVDWWYRQNVLVFAIGEAADELSRPAYPHMVGVDVVHPEMYRLRSSYGLLREVKASLHLRQRVRDLRRRI